MKEVKILFGHHLLLQQYHFLDFFFFFQVNDFLVVGLLTLINFFGCFYHHFMHMCLPSILDFPISQLFLVKF